MADVEQIITFPDGLGPLQVDDDGTTIVELGRTALRLRLPGHVDVDVISVHLKSKLLTFPGGRFSPRDEDERARYAVYALHRRAAEAAGIRSFVTELLGGRGQHHPVIVAAAGHAHAPHPERMRCGRLATHRFHWAGAFRMTESLGH